MRRTFPSETDNCCVNGQMFLSRSREEQSLVEEQQGEETEELTIQGPGTNHSVY